MFNGKICHTEHLGAGEACRAHNPEVRRSKLRGAIFLFFKRTTTCFQLAQHEIILPFSKFSLLIMFAIPKVVSVLRFSPPCRSAIYSTTSMLMEKFNIVVPPMGESIKSGIG